MVTGEEVNGIDGEEERVPEKAMSEKYGSEDAIGTGFDNKV